MISRKAKYALKAMLYLARKQGTGMIQIAEIASEEHIPQKFLEGILLTMKNRGMLASVRGKGGGYELAKPADAITLGEILRAMDGPLAPVPCASVSAYRSCPECSSEERCEIRCVMKDVRNAISGILDGTSLDAALRRKRPVSN